VTWKTDEDGMTRRVRIIGIGCGHPDQLTVEAVDALRASDVAIVMRKHRPPLAEASVPAGGAPTDGQDPLVAARRAILDRHAPGLRVIELDDPERDRSAASTSTTAGYSGVVADWHEARADAYEQALAEQDGDVALLVWGDPAFYDSTIRVVEKVLERGNLTFAWDVVPGISALQLLAARHRIVLHEVGQPILVTTGRRLREAVEAGADNVLVMLTATFDVTGLDDWHIWWGANLGTDSEALIAGGVADVASEITEARVRVKEASGWIMDVYLLRTSST
jgi:precorrin-6A synthase